MNAVLGNADVAGSYSSCCKCGQSCSAGRREDGSKPQAFHVVAPSLPGYGFSAAPTKPGFGIKAMAATMNELMLRLGYKSYVAQGAHRVHPSIL